jgi:hypothetical protein
MIMNLKFKRAAVVAITAVCLATLFASPNAASAGPDRVKASYRGKTITMNVGWSGAQSCVVESKSKVECFDSNDDADKYLVKKRLTSDVTGGPVDGGDVTTMAATPACADGWLCLFEHIDGKGRRLIFRDENWQDLYAYGFPNMTSSRRNNQPSADSGGLNSARTDAGALWISGRSYASRMAPGWNDWSTAVHG